MITNSRVYKTTYAFLPTNSPAAKRMNVTDKHPNKAMNAMLLRNAVIL